MTSKATVEDDWFSIHNDFMKDPHPTLYQELSSVKQQLKELQEQFQSHFQLQQSIIQQNTELKAELKSLKEKYYASDIHALKHDGIQTLLEELKILKQRELNMKLRERVPIPFVPSSPISNSFLKRINISPKLAPKPPLSPVVKLSL